MADVRAPLTLTLTLTPTMTLILTLIASDELDVGAVYLDARGHG